MAKFIIHITDGAGNQLDFVTSEHEGKQLLEAYPMYLQWLTESGFTLSKGKGDKPKQVINGKTCPKCGKKVWDNRAKKAEGTFNKKSPDFACSDKTCGWAVWPPNYEIKSD